MSIDSIASYNSTISELNKQNTQATQLKDKLNNTNASKASDEELMEVCKDFESYLVEQVFKSMKTSMVPESEDDSNEYECDWGTRNRPDVIRINEASIDKTSAIIVAEIPVT